MIQERLKQLRTVMIEKNISACIIPTADFHQSEYVGDYFGARKYMSGFTGSQGTLVVTQSKAALWTDGRYFIQAAQQLQGTTIDLMKMGEENVPSVEEYLDSELNQNERVAVDGRTIHVKWGRKLQQLLEAKNIHLMVEEDLVDLIWNDRPTMSKEPIFILDEKYSGESVTSKVKRVRDYMKKQGATVHVLSSLDDIAWLLNIRGNDVECNPVVLSYVLIKETSIILYVDQDKLADSVKLYMKENDIVVEDYEAIYEDMKQLQNEVILYDGNKVNYAMLACVSDDNKTMDQDNPTMLMKAIKNETEIEHLRQAHIKDGVCVTKFMYWLKTNIGKVSMTEVTASDYLEALRRSQDGFVELSFQTICAYEENAAMMHYSADEATCKTLEEKGLLLVDSGGQYMEGTTDITRTFVLGSISDEIKQHYTAVAKGMLNLANAKFLHGCIGMNLDILARGPIWDLGIDYKCGTGHGVGYLLNVHEAPNGFRWKRVPERNDSAPLEAGMVTTDEPGIYVEGSHGIRIENELVCQKEEKNEYGQFMSFETITLAPIDLDGILVEELSMVDKKRLNDYHKKVYDTLAPYLEEDEKEWLKVYTRAV